MPSLTCWKCSSPLTDLILPMSRREECATCHADQHVCMMCEHFIATKGCDEERAESVNETTRANFCDYFEPRLRGPSRPDTRKAEQAKVEFARLFGDAEPEPVEQETTLSPKELAEKKLRELLANL